MKHRFPEGGGAFHNRPGLLFSLSMLGACQADKPPPCPPCLTEDDPAQPTTQHRNTETDPTRSSWKPADQRAQEQARLDETARDAPTQNASRREKVDLQLESNGEQAITQMGIRNMAMHVAPGIVLHIKTLRGQMRSTRQGRPPALEDKRSYVVDIAYAEVATGAADLTRLLNTFVFGDPRSPIRNVTVSLEGDKLRQSGTLTRAGVGVAFGMLGTLAPTKDGKVTFVPTEVSVAGVRVDALLDFLKLPMDALADINPKRGVWLDGNAMVLDLETILPPPALRGKVTAIRIAHDEIVQVFGHPEDATPLVPPDRKARNDMILEGGNLEVGRLLMRRAKLQLVDADPSDALDFDIDHFHAQLEAGTERITHDDALVVTLPDYDDM